VIKNVPKQRMNRNYVVQKWENCRENTSAIVQMSFAPKNINKVTYMVTLDVKEDIIGDLVLFAESNRCSLDMKTCEHYAKRNYNGLCEAFAEKNDMFAGFYRSVEPRLQCHPLKSGKYSTLNTTLDLSAFSFIPIEGWIWIMKLRVVEKNKKGTSQKAAWCVDAEVKITKTRKLE
jgi:hypothetical protein